MDKNRKVTASEKVYSLIKERILSGEYEPEQMLNEVALSKEFGVSRTPIREALGKLEHEMLVTIYPKHGTIISSVDFGMVHDVFQIRKILEPFIILNYGAMIDRTRMLAALRSQLKIQMQESASDFHYQADADLHQIILDTNPNKYITETLLKVYDQNQRIRILTGAKSTQRLLKSCEEHLAIINCILCEDYISAAQKMDEHLTASWKAAIHLMALNQNVVSERLNGYSSKSLK